MIQIEERYFFRRDIARGLESQASVARCAASERALSRERCGPIDSIISRYWEQRGNVIVKGFAIRTLLRARRCLTPARVEGVRPLR
jgi:hypothetical protein